MVAVNEKIRRNLSQLSNGPMRYDTKNISQMMPTYAVIVDKTEQNEMNPVKNLMHVWIRVCLCFYVGYRDLMPIIRIYDFISVQFPDQSIHSYI